MDDHKTRLRKNERHLTPVATSPLAESEGPSETADKRAGTSAKSEGTKSRKPPVVRLVKPADRGATPEVAAHVARRLKAVYDDVLNQPIPERFLDLLNKLDSDGSK